MNTFSPFGAIAKKKLKSGMSSRTNHRGSKEMRRENCREKMQQNDESNVDNLVFEKVVREGVLGKREEENKSQRGDRRREV